MIEQQYTVKGVKTQCENEECEKIPGPKAIQLRSKDLLPWGQED